jgi:hypothetical protein
MTSRLFFTCLLISSALTSIAQGNIYQQTQYWLRYQLQLNFSPQLYWNNEADNRRFINPDVETQLIFHSRLHYKKGAWDFASGVTLSYAFASRPEIGYKNSTTEIRPVAEAAHEILLNRFSIQNRFRIDNRFFEVNEDESIWRESRYVTRLRYRLQFRIPIKKTDDVQKIGLRIADEIMVNAQENFFDQNRIYASTDFYISKKISMEVGYIYIYQQRFTTDDFFKRHILRFSVSHRINAFKN